MVDGNISMSHEEMRAAIADLRAGKDEYSRFLTEASKTVEVVTGRAYQTRTSSPAFKGAHGEWNGSTGQLTNSMVQVIDGIEQTMQIDQQTDQQGRGRIDQMRDTGGASGATGGGGPGPATVAGAGAAAGGVAAVGGTAARSRVGGSGSSGTGTGSATGGRRAGGGATPPPAGGGGPTPAGASVSPARDPVYSTLPTRQLNPDPGIAQRTWQPVNRADGARYAYDEVTYRGQRMTRTQGVQATVTRDMLRDVPRTASPPRALKATDPGYDNRYRLELGHLWADRLGGPNAARNFVPIHAYANGNRGMAHVESVVAGAVKQHGSVELVVMPRFHGAEPIPREIFYHWRVPGGQWNAMKIDNIP